MSGPRRASQRASILRSRWSSRITATRSRNACKAARAVPPPQWRPVAFSSLLELKAADRSVRAAAGLVARTSRCAADGGGHGRAGRHDSRISPRFIPSRHHAVEGGRAAADRVARQRVQSSSEAIERVAETPGPRSGADAPRLHPRPSASRRNRCAGGTRGMSGRCGKIS